MSVDQSAVRVLAQIGSPAAGSARWAHLPGRGRGPVQPRFGRSVKVGLVKLVKPVLIVGFFLAALWLCWQVFPPLLGFDGLVPGEPAAPTGVPAVDAPVQPTPVPPS